MAQIFRKKKMERYESRKGMNSKETGRKSRKIEKRGKSRKIQVNWVRRGPQHHEEPKMAPSAIEG